MQGGIYTREKCPICGARLKDNGRTAVACPDHPQVIATRLVVAFGRKHQMRFASYKLALKHLNYLRHEKDEREDLFDIRDYSAKRPKSFAVLAPKYLDRKQGLKSYGKICHDINKAADHFGFTNVRDISGGMIDDYLFGLVKDDGKPMSEKTRANHCSRLHDFWTWCLNRGDVLTLAEFPTFPKIDYELKYRKITTWEVQQEILEKVREITWETNPKIWMGCDMLATYTSLRPDDLRRVQESSLDDQGWLTIYNPTKKKNKFKYVRLHEDHVALWNDLKGRFPGSAELPFFRHHGKVRGSCQSNMVFGEHMFSNAWDRACKIMGIEGVPLYPGTKHTTATETAKLMGAERAMQATGLSNKAFDRYCQVENRGSFETVQEIRKKMKGKVLPLKTGAIPGQYRFRGVKDD